MTNTKLKPGAFKENSRSVQPAPAQASLPVFPLHLVDALMVGAALVCGLVIGNGIYASNPIRFGSYAVLEIPQQSEVPTNKLKALVPPANALRDRINERYDVDNRAMRPDRSVYLHRVQSKGNVLLLSASGENLNASKSYLEKVVATTVADVAKSIEDASKIVSGFVQSEREKIRILEGDLRRIDASMSVEEGNSIGLVFESERGRLQGRILEIELLLADREVELLVLKHSIPKVLQKVQPLAQGAPVSPSLSMFLTIGALVGLLVGILGVTARTLLSKRTKAVSAASVRHLG